MRAQVSKIRLRRAEGCTSYSWREVDSWAAADAQLRTWSQTAPENGSYDKCDFEVEWESGTQYSGRYDLKHWRVESPSLARHILDNAYFFTARRAPSDMTTERHRAVLVGMPDTARKFAQLLEWCDLGVEAHPEKLF